MSDRLIKAGIREPLYLTALKYAGIHLAGEMHVERMQDLMLEENHKEQIRKWFAERKAKEPAKEKPEVLRVDGICFGYTPEKENLTDISFSVREGEMVSIVGKNGAGKSTMTNTDGKINKTKGKIILTGAFMASALTACRRRSRILTA